MLRRVHPPSASSFFRVLLVCVVALFFSFSFRIDKKKGGKRRKKGMNLCDDDGVCVCSERGKRKKKRSSENPSDTLALARPRQDILCCIPFSFLGASPVRRLFLLFFFILPNWTFYVSFLAASLRCFNLRSRGIIYVSTSIPPSIQ